MPHYGGVQSLDHVHRGGRHHRTTSYADVLRADRATSLRLGSDDQNAFWAGRWAVADSAVHVRDLIRINNSQTVKQPQYWEHRVTARLLHFFVHHTGPAAMRHPWADIALMGLLHGPSLPTATRQFELVRTEVRALPPSLYIDSVPVAFPPDSPTLTVLLCIGIRKRQLDMSQLDMSQLVTVLVSMSAGSGQTIPRHSMMHQVNGIIMSLPAEVADFRDAPSMDEYLQYTANERVNDSEAEY